MILTTVLRLVALSVPFLRENETKWVSANSVLATGHQNSPTDMSCETSVPELCHSSPMSSGSKMDELENASSVVINKFKPCKFTFDTQIKLYD